MRLSHAAFESAEPSRNMVAIVRVASPPIWWQPVQPSVLTTLRIHSPWLLMLGEMPLPCSPVPGKSVFGGICISAYQYSAGEYCTADFLSGAATAVRLTTFPGVAFVFGESTRP